MPNSVYSRNYVFNNMYSAIKANVVNHVDNPQLLLILAIELNDVIKVDEALSIYRASPTNYTTIRNTRILQSIGLNYDYLMGENMSVIENPQSNIPN